MPGDGTAETKSGAPQGDDPVTISAPPTGSVTIDPQNPLPEPSFTWRRIFSGIAGLFAMFLTWIVARDFAAHDDMAHLYGLTKLVIYFAGLLLTYYFVAPSASELTNMIQTASIMRHSISLAGGALGGGQNRPETGAGERFGGSLAPESQIPAAAPGGAPSGPSGGAADSGGDDVAPHGRT